MVNSCHIGEKSYNQEYNKSQKNKTNGTPKNDHVCILIYL